MAGQSLKGRVETDGCVRRPTAADLHDPPVIAVLREAGEVVEASTREIRTASSGLSRAIAVLVVLPAVALPALMTIGSRLPWYSGSILAAYLPMIVLAALAWHYFFAPEWRGRQRRRAERMSGFEDTAELRRQLLEQ
jgi:hypothetical protein